ncbi:MAG TPA: hypothetical protein QGH10_01120 [Armatimonadota bacterium]|nr:hypothetical protein [Armatimonadota bacterium]
MRPIRLTIILLVIALLLLVVPIIRTSVFDTIGAMRQGDTVLPTTDDIRELQETHADDGEV